MANFPAQIYWVQSILSPLGSLACIFGEFVGQNHAREKFRNFIFQLSVFITVMFACFFPFLTLSGCASTSEVCLCVPPSVITVGSFAP